jgi:hypothetical protein
MAGYIGTKAVNLSTTGADINGDANVDGTLTATAIDGTVIGATTPAAGTFTELAASGTVASTTSVTGDFNFYATTTGGGVYRIYPDEATTANPTWLHQSNSSEDQAWVIGGVERMRIDSSGSTWIGGSTMPAGTAGIKLNVIGGSNDLMASYSTSVDAKTHWLFNNPNGTVGTIRTSASTTTYNTSSDYRLKENITAIQGAVDIVKAMRPCTYTFKADGDWADGFIAHELQELHPVAVTGSKDEVDEEGNPIYQGVDYSKLTPVLTAALQEALNKIDELTARIEALEAV